MHKKSMDAAKVLKDDLDDPSEANSCSGGITTDDDCSNAAAAVALGTSLPNDALPVSQSSMSPDVASGRQHRQPTGVQMTTAAATGGVEKDDVRSESIASLRAKAQNYSAQVYLNGFQRHRQHQIQQQQQRDIEDIHTSRLQRHREQFEYSMLYGGNRSELATLGGGGDVSTDSIPMADSMSVTSDGDDVTSIVDDDDVVGSGMRTAHGGGVSVVGRRGSIDVGRESYHINASSARV